MEQDEVVQLLRTKLELPQIELREIIILFQLNFTKWGTPLTYCWVKTLWKLRHEKMIHLMCLDFKPPQKNSGEIHT